MNQNRILGVLKEFVGIFLFVAVIDLWIMPFLRDDRATRKGPPAPWSPKVGDRVVSHYHADGSSGMFTTTVTNVAVVGNRSQSGVLVWGEGLPGVDSWWVKPEGRP